MFQLPTPKKVTTAMLAFSLLLFGSALFAGELERAQLAQLVTEIDFMIKRVGDIKADSTTQSQDRIVFRYEDLIHDLKTIKQGLSDYVSAELREGKDIPLLDGRYR